LSFTNANRKLVLCVLGVIRCIYMLDVESAVNQMDIR